MLLLAATAIVASAFQSPASGPVAPRVQARATIRILAGATVKFGEARDQSEAVERTTIIRTEGSARPAKLMEFQ